MLRRMVSVVKPSSRRIVVITVATLIGATVVSSDPFMISANDDDAAAKKKPIINYRDPVRVYQTVKRGKWEFEVEKQLIDEAPAIATQAVKRYQENLDEAFRLLPKPALPVLQELKFFVLYGPKAKGGGHDNGMRYYAHNAPKFHQELDERWSSCVVINCAENYTKLSNLWALKAVLHELGHAHHKENWLEKQEDIMAAWKNAVDKKLYLNVKDEKGKVIPKAYAMVNQLEYFAELTAMYFGRCNYAPFNRTELKKYDPVGYAMIQKMWGLNKDDPAPPPESTKPE